MLLRGKAALGRMSASYHETFKGTSRKFILFLLGSMRRGGKGGLFYHCMLSTRHGRSPCGCIICTWYALSPWTVLTTPPLCLSSSSYAGLTRNDRATMTSTVFISSMASSWPMQARGPCSKALHAPLTGYSGSSGSTSQRSGRKASACGQNAGSCCGVWMLGKTRKPSVGKRRPERSVTEKPRSPSRLIVTVGNSRRDSLITAVVKGSWLSRCGLEDIRFGAWPGLVVNTESCSARNRARTEGCLEMR